MPIYEYYCPDNHTIYQFYAKTLAQGGTVPRCPDNPKYRMKKLVSAFAITSGGAKDESTEKKPEAAASGDPAEAAARAKRDVSFSPLAMPMLSGPGSIAVTIGFTSLAEHWHDYAAIILGILVVALISYGTLHLAERVVLVIGANGMNALTKVMGFLILCIGIQFVVNGVLGILTDPALLRTLRTALTAT